MSFVSPEIMARVLKEREKREKMLLKLRLKNCKPWDPKIKWKPELNIKAKTYEVRKLFNTNLKPVTEVPPNPNRFTEKQYIESPKGTWRYAHLLLHKGHILSTWYGNRIGNVVFDGDVIIPAIYEKTDDIFSRDPWISLTPAEIISLRTGVRKAKGRVIVTGLGMGHTLIEVSKRKSVKEIIVIEISRELTKWLLPRIKEHMAKEKLKKVIIGDAYKEVPKLTADVALIDIFTTYGNNGDAVREIREKSKNIKTFWGWGTSVI